MSVNEITIFNKNYILKYDFIDGDVIVCSNWCSIGAQMFPFYDIKLSRHYQYIHVWREEGEIVPKQ